LFESPAARTAANVEKAQLMLGRSNAGGGTAMLTALYRALDAEHDPRRLQMYAFLTDGLVTEDDAILATIEKRGAGARFFAFGVGSSVNRALIDGIAEIGHGKAIYAMPRDGAYADTTVGEFFDAIDSPVLCDIDIDWCGLPVTDVMPRAPRDLFAAQPIVLHGRFTQAAQGKVLVRGRVGARHVVYEVPVDLGADNTNPAIGTIWARKKIEQLSQDKLAAADKAPLIVEITDLALRYNLASEYTSFVAVDESRVVSNGNPLRIFQPVEMPENLLLEGDARPAQTSRSVRVPGWGLIAGETADGSVLVLKVEDGSAAAEAGMKPGQVLRKVGGLKVRNLDSLESTLQQAKAGAKISIEAELVDDGQVHETKFDLPDPAGK
jgi:Ca-activated chloride channel family protein